MKKKLCVLFPALLVLMMTVLPIIVAHTAHAGSLADAIAQAPQGTEKGQIDPNA